VNPLPWEILRISLLEIKGKGKGKGRLLFIREKQLPLIINHFLGVLASL
jgi:hypothetical protein